MSCVLTEFAIIQDLQELIYWLCPNLNDKEKGLWEDDEAEMYTSECENHQIWLDECIINMSPTVDLMAIGTKNRLAILSSHRERNEDGEKKYIFTTNWKGILSNDLEGDEITSILCLPIISQKQSSSGAPDWTSVIVGFKSGTISIYTENGLTLLSQVFEEKSVQQINIRTYIPKNFGNCIYSDLSEELLILYSKCVVSVDGFSLLQTLKACRNQAAKAAAVGGECSTVTSLGYKKYSLSEIENVFGCIGTGMIPPHLYDHVIMKSNLFGFNQAFSGGVPTTQLLMAVGRSPYFSSFYIKEGFTQPFIADIALHYASKFKDAVLSAASGWIFGNKSAQEPSKKEKRKIEQPVHIPFRYTLPDKRRVGTSIQMATSRRLAAVTDDFGRVSVIDIQRNYVVRMFKGYRDAECGWINIHGDIKETEREVPFLIIHAPRRNILEVWLPQQGPRIAAFNVSKKCKLLYSCHSLLGAHTKKDTVLPTTPVVLINSEGTIERLSIPFHLVLSGKTSQQARDVHILKSIRVGLRSKKIDELRILIKEIKTVNVKIQLINLIIESKYLSEELAVAVLEELSFMEEEKKEVSPGTGDHEARFLSHQLTRLSNLLKLFAFISSLHNDTPQNPFDEHILKKNLCSYLQISSENLDELLQSFDDEKLYPVERKKVIFEQDIFSFSRFLSSWQISSGSSEKSSLIHTVPVLLKKKLSEEHQIELGKFLFGWQYNPSHLKPISECLFNSGVNELEILNISILYWHSMEKLNGPSTLKFFQILLVLAVFHQPVVSFEVLDEVKPIWFMIREKLVTWNKPLHAYVAALICKGIETNMLLFSHKINLQAIVSEESADPLPVINELFLKLEDSSRGTDMSVDTSDWEACTMDITEFNLLLARLKNLILVQKFYQTLVPIEERTKCQPVDYSVKTLKLKGKGYLSELIAKWFIESRLPIESIVDIINIEENKSEDDEEMNMETDNSSELDDDEPKQHADIKEQLKNLKVHFIESTKPDIIMVNLSWELAAAWKNSPNELYYFENCIKALGNISNAFFKHGVSSMMWETWIVYYVQVAAQLMEKVSRRPKDRLCMKDIGISEFNLESFFSLSKKLLEIIIQGNLGCEMERPPSLNKDEFWTGIDSSPSLADVSVAQKMTSCDLTFLHHQLLSVLTLIARYDLKSVKPYSLFPERDRASFFKPLISSWKVTSEEGREIVSSSQLSFLTRVVSAIVMSLPDSENSSKLPTPAGLYEAVEIGRSWGISVDAIRRHYVCELYSRGLDLMAEEALIMIRDGVMMASQMVIIAGKRLNHLLKTSPKSIELITLTTPNVRNWCKNLDASSLRCADVSIYDTATMVNKALILLPETNPDYGTASYLARSLRMICESGIISYNSN